MLPVEVLDRLFGVGEVMGLTFLIEGANVTVPLKVLAYEYPNNLYDFSLGTATALNNSSGAAAFQNIQDSSNAYLLRPANENEIWQGFYGINPGYTWVYRAYPANMQRGGLTLPATVGGTTGFIRGWDSPYMMPSAQTEFFTSQNISPAFAGYHPYPVPSTITVRMNFYMVKYQVEIVGQAPKRIIPIGGIPTVPAPEWVQRKYRRQAS